MVDFLLEEDGGFIDQENNGTGTWHIILDEVSAPGGFTSAVCTKANVLSQAGALPGGSAPPVTDINYACLHWTPSSMGGSFGYYEVGRTGRNGGSLVHITDESVTWFNDFECPRNTSLTYRLRSVANDGSASEWTNFPVLASVPLDDCVIVLANNARPQSAFACEDLTPYDYTFSSEDDVTLQKIAGRNMPVGFRSKERGGDIFTRTIYVAGIGANATNAPQGRALFDPVLNLIRDGTLAYVALCDANGRNWLTTPRVTGTRHREPGGVYTATIQFNESSDISVPFTTAAPWKP